ncbi:hypothetical protein P2G88_10085 [Aliiglaciecola sp. CAU 1673]|uniref:hypothetical protein n=1 Tax=Aliiglaciecola sp. CAU 1673 TaxID=3032595 RepID=UPI0023DCBB68|nr:hypothetical protein [Aliiglaciecola sp. CAU 1673]MDF2178596.1 hypothetical protein [Aliiglaciecola sp. CAU 1673]
MEMFIKSMVNGLVLGSLLSASWLTQAAEPNMVLCNYCTESQMQSAAVRTAPEGGVVHVWDRQGDKLKAYEITREHNLIMINPADVSQVIQAGTLEVKRSYDFIVDLHSGGIDINRLAAYLNNPNINSAYTIAETASLRNNVADAINQYVLGNVAGALTAAAGSLSVQFVNTVLPVNITIPIRFMDGTTYTFVFKGLFYGLDGSTSLQIEPLSGSGTDIDVKIPDNGEYTNFYDQGNYEAIMRTVEFLRSRGVVITGGENLPIGSALIIDCKFSEPGKGCTLSK